MTFLLKKKALKKLVSSLTMLTTIVSMSGMMALSSITFAAEVIADGDLIKSNATNDDGTPTYESLDVYIVKTVVSGDTTKLFKRLILNPTVFESYGHLNKDDIKTVDQATMDLYTTSALVRVDTDVEEKVYAMAPDDDAGAKSHINLTTEEATSVTGYDADSVYTINSTDGGSYTTVGAITTPAELTTFYTDGTLPDLTPVPANSDLSVALAASTPAAVTVSDGDGEVYTKVVLTAGDTDVTVSKVTVKRVGGAGEAADFNKIWVVVDGQRKSGEVFLGSDDEATLSLTVGDNNVVVPAGESKTISIAARMVGTADSGHSSLLAVTEITSDAGSVVGLPVQGNSMSVSGIEANDLTYTYKGSDGTVDISDKGVEVGKIRITNDESSSDITVNSITFRNNASSGTSAGSSDVSNFNLYVGTETTPIATVDTMDSDRYISFDLSSNPVIIEKGGSNYKDLTVKADINGGPSEYVQLTIAKTSDIVAVDDNGKAVDNTASGTAAEYTIQGGTLTLSEAADAPDARNVIDNQNDIVLLKANIIAAEEPIEISSLTVNVIGSISSADMNDIKAYVVHENGTQEEFGENTTVNIDATDATDAAAENTFDNTIIVEGTATLYVVVDLASGSGGTVTASIANTDITAVRTSDDATVVASGSITGGQVTVITGATLTLAAATSPGVATKVKGQNDVLFGALTLTATEDTEVTSLALTLVGTSGTADQNDVTDIELISADESTVYASATQLNASEKVTFTNFTNDMPVITNSGLKIIVRGDVNSTINDSSVTGLNFKVNVTGDVSASDGIGDATISGTPALPIITLVDAGTLNVQILQDEVPASQVLSAMTGKEIGQIKLTAGYETVNITKLVLTVPNSAKEEVSKVYLYDGASLLGSADVIGTTATFTGLTLAVEAGSSKAKTLTLKADMQSIDDVYATTSGTDITLAINDIATDLVVKSSGNSNTNVYGAVTAASGSNGVTLTTTSDETTYTGGDYTDSQTTLTMVATAGFAVGNLLLLDEAGNGSYTAADDEFVLITAIPSATTVTVRRGVAGSTAKSIVDDNMDIEEYTQKVTSSVAKYYGAAITVSEPATKPSGTLGAWGSYTEAFKFVVTPDSTSELSTVLNSVKISAKLGGGMGATTASDWFVSAMKLKNGAGTALKTWTTAITENSTATGTLSTTANTTITVASTTGFVTGMPVIIREDGANTNVAQCVVVSTVTDTSITVSGCDIIEGSLPTLNTSTADTITFGLASAGTYGYADFTSLAEDITSTGETFTLEVQISGTVADSGTDTLQFTIGSLGSATADGTVTDGDIDWDDTESTQIQWVDQANESVDGGTFTISA